MDEKDRLLLTYLQAGLPLLPDPFDVWASKMGTDRADVLLRIHRLKSQGMISGIQAVLNPKAFHYQSAWVAMQIESDLEARTEALWQHPGVLYGCQRDHPVNVWFFVAAPETHDLELHVRCLEKLAAAAATLFLPLRKVYKGSDVLSTLDAEIFPSMKERFEKRRIRSFATDEKDAFRHEAKGSLSAQDIHMIRLLQ